MTSSKIYEVKCPSCGAPLTMTGEGTTCNYCGAVLERERPVAPGPAPAAPPREPQVIVIKTDYAAPTIRRKSGGSSCLSSLFTSCSPAASWLQLAGSNLETVVNLSSFGMPPAMKILFGGRRSIFKGGLSMPNLRERLGGGLYGLLIGDAVGVPYEFHSPQQLPPLAQLDMIPPPHFARAHASVPPGTWSDDGAQALALLASLLEHGALNLDDFAARLVAWYQNGTLAVDGRVFDVGIQTSTAIRRLQGGTPAHLAGPNEEQANGNGALMRVLPLSLWHRGTDETLVYDAQQQSLVTHGHLRSQVCCALYCLWARRVLQEAADPWAAAVVTLRAIYGHSSPEVAELEGVIRPDDPPVGHGSGYVVDSLHSARWAVQTGSYEQVVKAAISLGHDTDTTACIAGGIAGLRDGLAAIPERWRTALRGQELVKPLLEGLLEWHQVGES